MLGGILIKETNRNASSTIFGFEYQINVAIYFMFHYLKEIDNIRVEGEKEDVEVTFSDKTKYMIQVKSQTKDLNDNINNPTKLRDALISLSEADKSNVQFLFYASNMLNPLNTSSSEFNDSGIIIKKYDELSPESKKKIDKQISNNIKNNPNKDIYNIDKGKLVIIRIPFFGEFETQRYKYIYEEAKEVLSFMSDTLVNKHTAIVKYCESKFLANGGTTNPFIKISKRDFCNWLILIEVESLDLSNDNIDIGIDEIDYYEAYQKYENYVNKKISNYENYSKVYSLYNRVNQKESITIKDFVKKYKITLYNYFFSENIEESSQINDNNKFDVYIAQIISYAILKKKSIISRIKKGANL